MIWGTIILLIKLHVWWTLLRTKSIRLVSINSVKHTDYDSNSEFLENINDSDLEQIILKLINLRILIYGQL